MENSFKSKDITVGTFNSVSEEESAEFLNNLSTQFDQVTGTQMKEIEVKKLEDEITIKRLEKEYRDRKNGLAYSMKKLKEYRKQSSNSTELMKRYVHAHEGFVEKANELKVFLNEVIMVNLDSTERKSADDKNKIAELTMTFQAITARDNHSNSLKKSLQSKVNEVNSSIARQIDLQNEECNKRCGKLMKSNSRIEALKKEFNQQTINSNLKDLIEKKGKRIIDLEIEAEKVQKQFNQETDAVLQDKNKLIQEKTNSKKSIQENDKLTISLQSEIAVSEKKKTDLRRIIEQIKTEKEKLFNNVTNERKNVESSKNALAERDADIEKELSKIVEKKQNLINNFTIAEESMHEELRKLHSELNVKKSLSQKKENCERIRWKLNENKLLNKKAFSNLGLEDKLKKAKDDFKKHEDILLNFNKKKNNFELKIKELEQQKIQESKKLESCTQQNEEKSGDKQVEVQTAKLNTPKNEVIIKKIQVLPKSLNISSIYSYKSSDSDESEDELKTKYDTSKNSQKLYYTPPIHTKFSNQSDGKEQTPINSANNFSSQKTATAEDTDQFVFKHPETLPYKRKTPQPKKN